MRHPCCFFFNECLFRSLEIPAELLVLVLLLSSTPGWAPATHTTRSCRGKSPSWRSATCERFQNETWLFISKQFFLWDLRLCVSSWHFSLFTTCQRRPPVASSRSLICTLCLTVVIYIVFLSFFPLDRRSLMEQLRRLQALIMNTSNRPAQTGTCVLVCLSSLFARKKTNHSPATPDK